jgi:DNA sulfur modification protein DndE
MIEQIRLSAKAKDQLVKLKRYTGLKNWNVLCRWGLCVSLAEPSRPADANIPADSNVEMSWKVFGGKSADIYAELLAQRCASDGIELTKENLNNQFRMHLHRGIGYLAADKSLRSIEKLLSRVN